MSRNLFVGNVLDYVANITELMCYMRSLRFLSCLCVKIDLNAEFTEKDAESQSS